MLHHIAILIQPTLFKTEKVPVGSLTMSSSFASNCGYLLEHHIFEGYIADRYGDFRELLVVRTVDDTSTSMDDNLICRKYTDQQIDAVYNALMEWITSEQALWRQCNTCFRNPFPLEVITEQLHFDKQLSVQQIVLLSGAAKSGKLRQLSGKSKKFHEVAQRQERRDVDLSLRFTDRDDTRGAKK